MRSLKPYNKNSLDFFQAVVDSKKGSNKDPNYKERLKKHNALISDQFETYDENFDNNTIIKLANYGFVNGDKDDLTKLYSYRSKLLQQLKVNVTTTEKNRILHTCQNCTISEVNSFDHFVSLNEFPEFSVHPKNLFPSCTKCNSYKGDIWRDNGMIQYLNLYLDKLPDKQYLFVKISIDNDDIVQTKFYLDNPHGIDSVFYKRIKNHYEKLHLCQRFQENIDLVITPMKNSICEYAKKLSLQDIIETVINSSKKNMEYFGYNYWKSILEIALIRNDDFLKSLKK